MVPSGRVAAPPPAFVRLAAHPLRWQLLTALADERLPGPRAGGRVDQPQNLVSYHLRLLRDGGLVTATRSSFDGRDSYYHLDLDRCASALADSGAALHPALRRTRRPPVLPVDRGGRHVVAVLFVCTGNSARSPIAEALLRHRSAGHVDGDQRRHPAQAHLHPNAVRVLRDEFGIDISDQRPQHLDTVAGRRFDHVITLCDRAREACPDFARPPAAGALEHPRPGHRRRRDQPATRAFRAHRRRHRHPHPAPAARPHRHRPLKEVQP